MSVVEFNEAILTNAEFLKPFAFTLTKDNEDAKDLFQETLLRALVNKEKYSGGTNIKGWLYIIMRNVFINSYRSKLKQKKRLDKKEQGYLINSEFVLTNNDAISNISKKEVKKAIYRLPDMFKKPFLFYFEGYKYHEIARMLKEPLGTVKSHIYFARKLLRAQIER